MLLPVVLAVGLATAAYLRVVVGRGVLYRQVRTGRDGVPFTLVKYRTMRPDAEAHGGARLSTRGDDRVVRGCAWLRRTRLDELPQLFNVLKGAMSLVGPRPLPVDETRRFEDLAHRRRLSVKPGLTCLWQISGRNEVNEFSDWVRLDLEYIDNWSLWLDIKILFRTIPVVFIGTGAK